MCLDTCELINPIQCVAHGKTGYKILRKSIGDYTPTQYDAWNTKLTFGHMHHASKGIIISSYDKWYPCGFHILDTLEDVKTLTPRCLVNINDLSYRILRVRYWGIVAVGKQYDANCVIALRMCIEEDMCAVKDFDKWYLENKK